MLYYWSRLHLSQNKRPRQITYTIKGQPQINPSKGRRQCLTFNTNFLDAFRHFIGYVSSVFLRKTLLWRFYCRSFVIIAGTSVVFCINQSLPSLLASFLPSLVTDPWIQPDWRSVAAWGGRSSPLLSAFFPVFFLPQEFTWTLSRFYLVQTAQSLGKSILFHFSAVSSTLLRF